MLHIHRLDWLHFHQRDLTRWGGIGTAMAALLMPSMLFGTEKEASPLANQLQMETPQVAPDAVARARAAMGLSQCEVAVVAPVRESGGIVTVELTFGDQPRTLRLAPHSDRSLGFRVLAQGADGVLRPADPGPVRTLRGFVAGESGSRVSCAWLDDGFHASIRMPDGQTWWVQPLPQEVAGDGAHVIYRTEDVLPSNARCGMPNVLDVEAVQPVPMNNGAERGGGEPCVALLACDADVEFYQLYLSSIPNVVDRISMIMNTVNAQYENEVGITHQLGTIIVRTAEPDPYTSSANNTLLCQFITQWVNNHSNVERDVAQLFTGRAIDGDVIGQAADIGDICNEQGCCSCGLFGNDGSYCFVESNFNGPGTSFALSTTLSAHELGHLWNAHHCPCVAPAYTMNPFIVAASQHHPVLSIPPIIYYRTTRPCLEPCEGGNVNDECVNATLIGEGSTPFDTIGATTDGLPHPGLCQDDGQTYNDVWFHFVPLCTTDYTISVCSSEYDTDLVVYSGSECLPGTERVVACNDDSCNTGIQSTVQAFLHKDQSYLIRIGGWRSPDYGAGTLEVIPNPSLDTDGDGVLNCVDNCPLVANPDQEDCDGDGIGDACSGEPDCNENGIPDSCDITAGTSQDLNGNGIPDECEPSCTGDINSDGVVNVSDLLAVINAWGPCPDPENCPADINDDDVVNVSDLLAVINNWGPCQ